MTPARAHVLSAVALAGLVAAALVLRALHAGRALTLAGLALFATAGFAGVVAFHMNLRTEPRWLRILFAVPLAFALLFAVSLVADTLVVGPRP